MGTNWAVDDVKMVYRDDFIRKAQELSPELLRRKITPIRWMESKNNEIIYESIDNTELAEKTWGKDEALVVDFGHHGTGYLSFDCQSYGSPQDAPAFIKLKFCEIEQELYEDSKDYQGWISKGWIQEEWIHIDYLPQKLQLQRRYAFRYVKIDILDTSQKFRICMNEFSQDVISAVNMENVKPAAVEDPMLKAIDEAALRTLQNCMQAVFEDGPKRDRRLWLGDLKLQAMVNYETFYKNDLVKRCLYLFAGMTRDDGMIAACLFTEPKPLMDDTFLLDYSLFFIPVLYEYFVATQDMETLLELKEIAFLQLALASHYLDDRGIMVAEGEYHCFIDWNELLDKQCAMQGVYLYALSTAIEIARILKEDARIRLLEQEYEKIKKASLNYLWNDKNKAFTSGESGQISIASQVWMILAGAISGKEAAELLLSMKEYPIQMITPYMNHYYMEALLLCGEHEEAILHMKSYWGGMILAGADTFWELFNPKDWDESPYGSKIINSYCHAWSCTPAYFMRKL